jgi:hypothetical protein
MAVNAKQASSDNSSLAINFFSIGNFNGSREYLVKIFTSKTGIMSFIRKITSTNPHYFVSIPVTVLSTFGGGGRK